MQLQGLEQAAEEPLKVAVLISNWGIKKCL